MKIRNGNHSSPLTKLKGRTNLLIPPLGFSWS